jgi:hypothetical protein
MINKLLLTTQKWTRAVWKRCIESGAKRRKLNQLVGGKFMDLLNSLPKQKLFLKHLKNAYADQTQNPPSFRSVHLRSLLSMRSTNRVSFVHVSSASGTLTHESSRLNNELALCPGRASKYWRIALNSCFIPAKSPKAAKTCSHNSGWLYALV